MTRLNIEVKVTTTKGNRIIKINDVDLEALAETKAEAQGFIAKKGKILSWFRPRIEKIEIIP